jgi:protoheme IX farnesyltransferase
MTISIFTSMLKKLKAIVQFTKPGISRAQLITASIGYFLAKQNISFSNEYLSLILATYFYSAAACAANNFIERGLDSKMNRTRQRAMVTGEIRYLEAIVVIFLCLIIATYFVLNLSVETRIVSWLTVIIYVGIYTPLKRISWLNTHVGAIPGALPLLGGWMATETPIHLAVISLFFTLFAWQIPHFYALAIMYMDEYSKAGFRMLPNLDGGVVATKRQMILFSILMLISSMVPYLIGFLSIIYFVGVSTLSMVFLAFVIIGVKNLTKNARKLFVLSIIYLPLWFALIIIDIVMY